jgi:hypothetical protein
MWRTKSAKLLTLLLLVVLSTLAVVAPATPASAAGCNANGCTGKNPQVQGCSPSARTIDEFSYTGIRFELRYSSVCFAAWTRVTSLQHHNTIFGQIRGGGHVFGVQAVDGQVWTKMISFNFLVRSCRAIWFDASPIECTAFH